MTRLKVTKKTINEKASRFHKVNKVLARIEELRSGINGDAIKTALYTIEDKKRILLDTALFGSSIELVGIGLKEEESVIEKQRNPSATVAAIKELNLMDGDHAPKKEEVDMNIDLSNVPVEVANELTTNELRKILSAKNK